MKVDDLNLRVDVLSGDRVLKPGVEMNIMLLPPNPKSFSNIKVEHSGKNFGR